MNKSLLIMLCGLPRSGKGTWAKSTGLPMVNPDSLRTIIHGTPFRQEAEPLVWATAKIMVASLFEAGHPIVILDATNTTRHRRSEWNDARWDVKYKCFNTPEEICIERALLNKQDYLVPVIKRMAKQIDFPKDNLLSEREEFDLRINTANIALQNTGCVVD